MKKQILFVDDESHILEGLRRMLRGMRNEWNILCALSGAEALDVMAKEPIQIIVTDMRMPEMDGAALLCEVMKRHPNVIRMVLSGHADAKLIMKSVGVAHQFISKPCDPETLKAIINGAIGIRALLKDSRLESIIAEMNTLPSVPSLYVEMADELKSPEPSVTKVSQIISRDPSMTARILQLVNSAFFGLRRRISNPEDGVSYLGLERIQHLFLVLHAFSQFVPPETSSFAIEPLWEHSISTAVIAKAIAEREEAGKSTIDDAFAVGLLHDIGQLMLACKLTDKHEQSVKLARNEAIPLWQAEQQILSVTHAEVGAYLLGLWGLPDPIVEATAYHHNPVMHERNSFCPLTALHTANSQVLNGSYPGMLKSRADTDYLSKLLRKTTIPDPLERPL